MILGKMNVDITPFPEHCNDYYNALSGLVEIINCLCYDSIVAGSR